MKNFTFSALFCKYIGNILNLRPLALSLLFVGGVSGVWGQVTVSWRNEAANGNWENGSNPCNEIGTSNSQWWYGSWSPNNARNRPDCYGSHILNFDNNHQLTMSLGSLTFNVHQIIFANGNSNSRTIGSVGNGTINFFEFSTTWPKIQNNSSAIHTINSAVVASPNSGNNLELVASTGGMIFGGTMNNNGRTIQIYGNNSSLDASNRYISLGGIVSGTGVLNVSQFGVVRLNAANTYTGQTQIDNGELWIESAGSISGSSSIFVGNGGQLANVAKLWLSNSTGGTTFSNNLTINNGNSTTRYIGGINTSGTHTFSGNITNNSSGGLYLSAELAGGTTAFSGVISGSNPVLTSGAGTVVISGSSANTYTGATTIGATTILNKSANVIAIPSATTINNGITLRTDAANQWGTGTPPLVTINGNGVLNLNNNNQKIALASSSSTASVSLGSGTLNVDNSGSDTYAGGISGSGGVTKTNTGVQILTNTALSYTGATTITGGEIRLQPSGDATFASQVVLNGGTLSTTGITSSRTWTSSSTLNLSANSTIALASATDHTITFAASNAVSWTATANLVITGWSGTYNGTSNGTTGKIFIGNSASGLTSSQLARIYFFNGTNHYTAVQLSTGEIVPTANIAMFWNGSGTWSTANTWSLSSGGTYNQTWVTGRAAVFNVASSAITGASTNVASIIANENVTFTPGGTLGTNGTVAPIFVANSKTLNFAGQAISTAAGTGFIKNGPGTFISANGNAYPGGFTLNDGLMVVGGVNAMGNGGTLTINGGTIGTTASRNITARYGSGGIVIGGDFTIGATGYTSTFTFGDNVSLGSSTRTITLGAAATQTFNGVISGSAGLTLNATAAGILVFVAANTYSGSTTIGSNATLRLGVADALPVGGAGLILNGGTLSTGASSGFSVGSASTNAGTLNLAANSSISLGTGNHSIYFAASNAVTWNGSTLTITGWTGNDGESGTAGKIFVGNSATGLTADQLAKITINGKAVTQLSTGEIVPRATIYRSAQTGNWSSTSTWERSLDGGVNWVAAVATPTSADGTITIRNGHTVSITSAVTIDEVTIDNGGTVIHSGGIADVTLANGAGTDLTINGTWKRTVNSYTIALNASATISVGSTGVYEHAITASGGSIPSASWDANSTLKITPTASMTSYPTGLNQTFGKVEVNCASQSSSNVKFFINNAVTELKVISTGSGSMELNDGASGLTIAGSYIQTGGTVKVNYSGSIGIGNATFTVGDFSLEGGTFIISDNPGSSYYGQLIVNGNYSQSGGTINFLTGNGATYLDVKGNMSLTGGNFTTSFTSANTGIYFIGTGPQSLTLGNLSSYTSALNTRFYYKTSSGPTALNETYSSTSSQNTISGTTSTSRSGYAGWPTTGSLINNLTINNSAGVTLTTAKQVNGTLILSNGKLTTNGNNLTLVNSTSGSSSSYVVADATGTLTMNAVSSAKTVPIGTSTSYAPLVLSAGSSTNYSTYVTSTLPCAVGNSDAVVNLAWNINGSNAPSNVVFQWNSGSQGSAFNPANSCELGRYGSTCPYTATTIGVASGSGPYTLSVSSGLASGNNIYSIGNINSIVPAGPSLNSATLSSALSTTYGTASSGVSFTASGTNLTANITATAQSGYEVSTSSGSGYGSSVSVADGTTVWVRLAATQTVGTYNSATAVVLSSTGATNVNVSTSSSGNTVSQKALTITGLTAENKVYDGLTTATATGTASLSGVVGADVVSITGTPTFAFADANVGTGISVSTSGYLLTGTNAGNYTLTQPTFSANITVRTLTITANNVSKYAGVALTDGAGSTAFSSSGLQNGETIGSVTITYGSAGSATGDGNTVGVYSSQVTPSGATGGSFIASNYSISYVAGSITVVEALSTIAEWNFATATASNSNENITAPVITQGNNNGTTTMIGSTSASSGYTGASGTNNAGAAARTGALSTASSGSAYFEFTITPNNGYQVTMKELSFGSRGTSTGPQSVTLRSSADNYASDIFTATLLANSNWALYSNSAALNEIIASARTYRIYGYNGTGSASANTANWRIDDLKLQGYVKSVPQLSTPTSTSIATTSATLGATITSDGGDAITARGTVYGTSAAPTANSLAEGGTSVSAFSHSRAGLTANTLYYYRGYAVNSVGTGYSTDGTFTTLHNAPTVGSGSNATTTTIDASWTAPSGGSATFTYEIQVDDNSDFSSPTFTQSSISSATTSITATGLTSNTTYYFRVRANNAGGNSAWSSSSAGYATLEAVNPTLSTTALTAFGNVCLNVTSAANSFTINGSALTSADVTVSSLSGYTFSTTEGGTYTSSLTLTQGGGTYSQSVFVKFTPTAVQSYNGNIVVSGGGASSSENVAASGSGIAGTVNVTTTVASSISTTGASTGGTSVSTTCGTITEKGVAYATTANPTSPTTSDGTGTGNYTSTLSGLTPNTEYNYRAYATNNNGVTSYGSNLTFTTIHNAPTVGNGSLATTNGFTANWTAPSSGGSATFTYEIAVSTSSSFASTLSSVSAISSGTTSYQFTGLTDGTTYYFRVRANNAGGSSAWSSISAPISTISTWENFETGTKGSYTSGNVTCTAGSWNLNDALIGTSASDRKYGLQSIRIQNTGIASINFDVTNGISSLTIHHALYGSDASATWRLEVSNNSGSTWDAYVSSDVTTSSTTLTAQTFNVDLCGTLRFRIVKRTGSQRINFDDIVLVEKGATPTAPNASAQSFCSSDSPTVNSLSATGSSLQWYSASTGGSALATNTALSSSTYYVSQTVSGCESARTSVAVTINSSGTWIGGTSTDWSNAANWCGGVPTSATNVTIPSGTANSVVISSSANVNSLTINSGATISTSGTPTITISNNGSFTNNGTFTAGTSTVSFAGNGTVSGTVGFNNVDIAGGVNFGSASTINGTLSINSGGSINTNAPLYGVGSTLKYNTGVDAYGRSLEWSATSGQGAPYSVQVSGNTILNYPNTGSGLFTTNFSLAGNLTIDNGSALYMDYGGGSKSGRLDVAGNVLLNGNLSLGNASGGDIKVGGNWTRNSGSTLNTNGRAVFFTGSGNSTIAGNGGETFPYMVNEKTGGSILLGSNLTLTAPSGGNALTHKSTASIDLNSYNLTFSGPDNSNILADGACSIIGTGNVLITSNTKNLTGQNTGSWTFGSNVVLKLQSGLNFGTNLSTINGTLEINNGGYVSGDGRPTYGVGSTLKYNSSGSYGRDKEWLAGYSTGAGVPYSVLISSGTTLDLGANSNFSSESWVRNELTVDGTFDMSLTDQVEPVNVLGNVTFNGGTLKLSTTAGGDIKVGGNWTGTGTFVANSRAVFINGTGNQTISRNDNFPYLIIDKTSGTLSIAGNITLNNKLTYSDGSISFSGGSIDASGASAEIEFANSSAYTLPTGLFSSNVNKLTVNGTGGITLSENVTVTNSLKLTSGVITLGSRNLTLSGGLDASGNGSSSSYINTSGSGAFIRSISSTGVDYKFPVGLSSYAPISVNFTGGSITSSSLASRAVSGLHPNATDGAYIRTNLYWEMNQTGMTNPQYNVSFTYPGVTNGTGSNETESNLLPAKWSASTGWLSSGGCSICFTGTTMGTSSINTSTKTITWNGVTGFSDFGGFGQGNGSPLPVELTSFSASCEEDVVTLSWSTASEQNSSHFDMEKSIDGEIWRVIGTVLAAGNSTQDINYSFIDDEKSNGQNYYRLNQVDIDGKNEYFGPIQTNCVEKIQFTTFPNPSDASFQVILSSKELVGMCSLVISDATGKVIEQRTIDVKEGINLFVFNQEFTPGIYFLNVTNGTKSTPILRHTVK
jgi:hypothetical protein